VTGRADTLVKLLTKELHLPSVTYISGWPGKSMISFASVTL